MNRLIELIEVAIVGFRYISERTTIPVPRLFGYGFKDDNPTGCSFMITEYIDGASLLSTGANDPCDNMLGT